MEFERTGGRSVLADLRVGMSPFVVLVRFGIIC